MRLSLLITCALVTSATARRMPHMRPSELKPLGEPKFLWICIPAFILWLNASFPWIFLTAADSFGFPYGWGLDAEIAEAEAKKSQSARKIKEVKHEKTPQKKETKLPPLKSIVPAFPIPHDHLDDIFLSTGGVE